MNQPSLSEYEDTEKETWTLPILKKLDIEETAAGLNPGVDGIQSS